MENGTKKLDVTIQTPGNDMEDGVTLAEIFSALKKGGVKLLAWLLIGVLVGGLGGSAYVLITRNRAVSSMIAFGYDGVEKGLDPAGAVLDVNKLKSPQIIEPALREMGIEGLDAEQVRQEMTIEGIVPQDVIDRLTVITTIATNANAVGNLEKVLDVDYYPTQFKINLGTQKLALNTAQACQLLDAILSSYRAYFFDTYANTSVIGTALGGVDYEEYDYTEALDILTSQLQTIRSYVLSLNNRERGKDFRSTLTGYSFQDILSSLDIIRSADVMLLDALVYSYNLTRDKPLLLTYLDYQKEELGRQVDVALRTQETINEKLSGYEKDTVLVMGTGESTGPVTPGNLSMTLASTEYDNLIEQSIDAAQNVAELNARIAKIDSRIEKINTDVVVPAGEYARRCEEADEKLRLIKEKLVRWADTVSKTAEEFYDTEAFNDAYKVLLPAQKEGGLLKSILLYGGVAAVGLAGLILMIYVISVCLKLAAGGSKKEAKHGKNAARADA